jgi:NAD(P)H-flavin reductase
MALLADTRIADPLAPVPFVVRDKWDELEDTFTIELEPPEGRYPFAAGQFTMLYAFGIGEVPISISGDPAAPETLIHTIRGVGAVTKALREVEPGSVVGVRGPFGTPWPVAAAEGRDVVLVAGGIGLAPLRPAIYEVLNHRDRYNRVVLLYGARSPHELLYPDLIQEWRSRFDMDVLVSVDNAGAAWKGSVGVVTKLIRRAPFDPHASTAFVCGPEIMMRFTADSLVDRGVPAADINVSMERNMKCAVGFCGHCQFNRYFVCKDGPVFSYADVAALMKVREV